MNDSRLQIFTSLKDSHALKENVIVIDGKKNISNLVEQGFNPKSILISEKHTDDEIVKKASEVITITDEEFQKIVGYNSHQGMIALFDRPKLYSVDDIDGHVLILNSVRSAENVGTIVRTAAAFNIKYVLYDTETCSPLQRRPLRVSMGQFVHLKFIESRNIIRDLNKLKEKGFSVLGTTNRGEPKSIGRYKFSDKCAVIIGSEGEGISSYVSEICDDLLNIPMNEAVNNINAASATAIILYQLTFDRFN